jgi:hypothetical protein
MTSNGQAKANDRNVRTSTLDAVTDVRTSTTG